MICPEGGPCPDAEWCQTGGDCATAKRYAKPDDYNHADPKE